MITRSIMQFCYTLSALIVMGGAHIAMAQTLPGLALPDAPSGTAKDPAKSDEASHDQESSETEEASESEEKMFSYGRSDISVLFLKPQISGMKNALMTYESTSHERAPAVATPTNPIPQAQEVITEPASYPVFFLSTIAYEKPDDWSIWISNHKITAHKNDTDVQVLSVSRESATLAWKPDYFRAIQRRKAEKLFADPAPVKNKLAVVQRIEQDEAAKTLTFTLRQNQSFAVGYYSVFEGYMESPKLLALPAQNPNQMPGTAFDANGTPTPGDFMDPNGGQFPPGGMPGMNPDLPPGMNNPVDPTMPGGMPNPGGPPNMNNPSMPGMPPANPSQQAPGMNGAPGMPNTSPGGLPPVTPPTM